MTPLSRIALRLRRRLLRGYELALVALLLALATAAAWPPS